MPVQQYTAEMHLILAVVVLAVVVLAGVLIGIRLYRVHDSSDQQQRKRAAVRKLAQEQDSVISDVIVEISSNPATYAGFPQLVISELMRLHSVHPSVMKGIEREIY